MWKNSLLRRPLVALFVTSLICAALAQDDNFGADGIQASSATLEFNSDPVIVNPGQRLNLYCGVKGKYRSCIWEQGGENQRTFQIEDVYDGVISGLSKPENTKDNQCGIVINSVEAEDNGEWTCRVFVPAKTLTATKNVVVTVRPTQPTLVINENPLVITEDEQKSIDCFVPAARPAARIRWLLNNEDVTGSSTSNNTPTDNVGTYRTDSTFVYKFSHQYDRMNLRCNVEHPTLDEPEYSEVSLDIRYQPYPISSTDIYGIPMDSEYEIKYNFTSNPVPEMRWFIENEEVPVPGESGRYMANIKNLMDNIYMATLRIRDFQDSDVGRTYKLHAANDFGERTFDISLSTGPAPPDGDYGTSEYISSPESNDNQDYVGTGAIVAIIVIVVFIIILLFIIGIMRYRQMYCFGSKDKIKNHMKDTEDLKEEHDTESSAPAREPNNSKRATNLLKNIRSKFPKPTRKGQDHSLHLGSRGPKARTIEYTWGHGGPFSTLAPNNKEPRLDKLEEGENKEPTEENVEEKGKTNPEVVYAELELGNGESKKDGQTTKPESTEYAEIVGTVPDDKRHDKK